MVCKIQPTDQSVSGRKIYIFSYSPEPSDFIVIRAHQLQVGLQMSFFLVASGGFASQIFQLQMGMKIRKMLPLSPEIIFG